MKYAQKLFLFFTATILFSFFQIDANNWINNDNGIVPVIHYGSDHHIDDNVDYGSHTTSQPSYRHDTSRNNPAVRLHDQHMRSRNRHLYANREPDLHAFSEEQLRAYFHYYRYTETQALDQTTLFASDAFVRIAKQCSGYEDAVAKLYEQLSDIGWLKKAWLILQGTYCPGLQRRICALYQEVLQQREQRERDRALAARQAEQKRQAARALEKKKWDIHEQFQASLPALHNDAVEYDELRLQYHEAVPLFFERLDSRQNALDQIARNGAHYTTKTYQLNRDVVALLREYNHSTNDFSTCFGNQYQHVIHQEAIDIVDTTAQLSKQSTTYAYRDILADFATGICGYVRSGYVDKATQIANFCWTFLDYGKDALEVAVTGAINTINCIADHPIETALYPVAGKYILAYQLGKILYNIADLGITYNESKRTMG